MHTSSSRFSTCRRIVAAFIACIACCVGAPLTQTLAVDYTWTSATTGGSWSVTGNWTPTGAPTSGDTAALTDATVNRTVFYNAAASGTLTGLSFTQTTSGVLNELRVQRNLTVTNALVLGASSGTAQLTLAGTSAANITGTFSGGITVNSGGVLSLANFNPAGSAAIFNSNLTGNVTVSGGRLDFSWVKEGTATSSANSLQVLTGNLTMSSGTIAFDNPLGNGDRRLQITGDVSITGGRFTTNATANASNIRFDGASILFAPTSYDSARFQINLGRADAQTYSGSTAIQLLIVRGSGIKTVSNSGTIASISMNDENTTGSSRTTLKLGSNLTSGSSGLTRGGLGEAGATRLDYGVDADIYTLDLTAASGAWTPGAGSVTTQWALTGTAGRIIANGFAFNSASVGTTVGPGLILESRAGNSVANNLSLGTSGTGAIDPTSVFRYAGSAAVATPSTLTSTRAIGDLEVTSGALRISSLAGLQNVRVTGGTLDLNNLSLSVTSGSFGGGSVTSGTLTSGTFLATSGTVSASLAGVGGTLTKSTSGTFTLSGSNAYDGGTRINGGVLAIDNTFALGTSGSVTFGGGTLQYTANSTLADISPNVLGSGSAISIDTNGQSITFGSALASSNSGGLTKLGSGTLSLSAANAYTGASTVSAGTLLVNNASALGNAANALAVNGGSLNLNGNSVSVGTLSGSSGATISTNSSAGTATLSTSVSGSSTFGGVIQDNGSGRLALTKLGSGTLVLAAVNTYTGTTSVNAGTLQIGVAGGAAGRVTGDTAVNTGGRLLLTNVSGTLGNVAVAGGRMDLSTNNANIGALSMTSGTLGLGNTTLRLSVWGNASVTGGNVVEPGSGGVINFYGTTNVFAPQTLSPGGSFQLIASGNQTYSGSTALGAFNMRGTGIKTVSNSGTITTLQFINDTAGSPVTLKLGSNLTVGTGGLNLAGFSQVGTALSFGVDADTYSLDLTAASGAWTPGTGGTGTTALWTLAGTAGRIIANGFDLSSARVNSSVGPGLVLESRAGNSGTNNLSVGTGSGTIDSTSVFRYAGTAVAATPATLTSSRAIGDLEVTSGALRITSLAGLQNVRVTGGTLDLGNQSLSVTSGSFGGGSVTSGTLTSSTFLATSGTVGASLAGVGGTLTKTTSGTFVLTGVNTFTGATDVNAGTLAFDRVSALNSSSGIGIAGGAILDYTGGAGTLSRNVTVSSSGTGTIRNSGGQTLTLSGTLTKDGRVLQLTGGAFNVTGQIVGASANSDLLVNGTSTVTLSAVNSYDGPTFVNQASTLIVGINNAIPNNSTVTLGDATSAGTLDLGTFTNQIGGLVFSGSGGTVRMAANQTASPQLSTSAALSLGSNASLDLTGMQTSAGIYRLISSTALSGSFGSVTGLNSNYLLRYGTVNANEVSAQRKAEFGTVAATPAAVSIITGGSTAFSYTVVNATPTGGSTLSFTSANGANIAGSSNGTAIAGGTSASISGLVFTGTGVGLNQTGSFTLTDPNAIGSPANGSVSVNVLNHSLASFASTDTATKTLDFGSYDAGNWSGGDGGNGTLAYSVFNIAALGFSNAETAGLNLYDWAFTSGDNVFSVGFSSFANLAAGGSNGLFATVVSPGGLAEGSYSGTYTLKFRDQQDLSGAANTRDLTLTMNVVVVPEPGAIALAAIGIAAAAWARRRRK